MRIAPYFRPYLHMYARSNELEEKGVINLNAVNVESNPDMEILLGVSR
jgi:kinesin family protein 1